MELTYVRTFLHCSLISFDLLLLFQFLCLVLFMLLPYSENIDIFSS